MAYGRDNAIGMINKAKNDWDIGNNDGDEDKKLQAKKRAEPYYKWLRDNNYGGIAEELAGQNSKQAEFTRNFYGKQGNTEFRPYLYGLGKKMGLSEADVDKQIKWDETTGEIAFGGKNLGAPYAVVDGKSYFNDTSVLDKAFKDYAGRVGITRNADAMYKQGLENIQEKVNQQWGQIGDNNKNMSEEQGKLLKMLYDTNPYDTEVGKSIMQDFTWNGAKSGDNEIANIASSNGGNIDSFSAANAAKQQLGFEIAGKNAVREDWNSRIQNIQNTLNNIGIYQQGVYSAQNNNIGIDMDNNQRVIDNDQSNKNNETARNSQKIKDDMLIAETYGKSTSNQYTNPYIGKVSDFKEAYNMAKANGASNEILNQIAEARFMKQVGINDFSAGFIPFKPTTQETANMLLTNKQINSAERIANAGNEISLKNKNAEISSNEKLAGIKAKNELDKIYTATQSEKELMQEQAKYGTTKPTMTNTTLPTDFKPKLTAPQSEIAVNSGIVSQSVVDDYNYWHGTDYTTGNMPTRGSVDVPTDVPTDAPTDEQVNVVNFSTVNNNAAKAYGVDQYGINLLNKLKAEAVNKGGFLTDKEIYEVAVNTSDDNNTNKNQIVKVFDYLGVNTGLLGNVSDSGVFPWNWDLGVKVK